MKKIIIFQFILLFSLGRVMADQELPVLSKQKIEEVLTIAGEKAKSVFSKVADYMPKINNQPTFLKKFEDCVYLFEKNVENAWSGSLEMISKAYVDASEFASEASKNPAVLQEKAQGFYDQGLLFVDRHQTFSKVAGVIGALVVASYIRKKIIRRASIK